MNPSQRHHRRAHNHHEQDSIWHIEGSMKSESSSSDPPPTVTTGQNTAGMSTSSSSYHFKEGAEKVDIAETTPPCQQEAMVTTFPQAAKAETILSSLDALAASEQLTRRKKDFPWKLHCMLEDAEKCGNQHIISWQPDGLAFRVIRPGDFVSKIMPYYFQQTQYRSFQRMVRRKHLVSPETERKNEGDHNIEWHLTLINPYLTRPEMDFYLDLHESVYPPPQLNLYEFQKVQSGPNRGSYNHPSFLRSDRSVCLQMRIRKRIKRATTAGSVDDSPTPAKKWHGVPGSDVSLSFSASTATAEAEMMKHWQLGYDPFVRIYSNGTVDPIHQHHDHLRDDSGGQQGFQHLQQPQHLDTVPPSLASSTPNAASMVFQYLEPTTLHSYGNDGISTVTTTLPEVGGHLAREQDQQFLSYRQPQLNSQPDCGVASALDMHGSMDRIHPQFLGNNAGTTTNTLTFLPAAWNMSVTGSDDGDTKEEMMQSLSMWSTNTGGTFRFPTKVPTRHSALEATPRDEVLHEAQQQQLQQGQDSEQGRRAEDGHSLSFLWPLSSDLEPTPLPP